MLLTLIASYGLLPKIADCRRRNPRSPPISLLFSNGKGLNGLLFFREYLKVIG